MPRTPNPAAAATTTSRCERCDGPLVEISLALDTAGSMTMRSCSECDTRYWQRDGRDTNLTGALATMAAGGVPRARRQVVARRAAS